MHALHNVSLPHREGEEEDEASIPIPLQHAIDSKKNSQYMDCTSGQYVATGTVAS